MDPTRLVREGFDRLAPRYLSWAETVRRDERERYTRLLLEALPEGARVLDLGCGPGGSTTCQLAARFRVVGVDLSWECVAAARRGVPRASFIQADMTRLSFPAASFDGIGAFYSLVHVPRAAQPDLLARLAAWSKPGGIVVLSLGARGAEADLSRDWLGVPMFWSSFDADDGRAMVERAGLEVVSARIETARELDAEVPFLWIVARRPSLRRGR